MLKIYKENKSVHVIFCNTAKKNIDNTGYSVKLLGLNDSLNAVFVTGTTYYCCLYIPQFV